MARKASSRLRQLRPPLRLMPRHFLYGMVQGIAAFIRAKLPSGFFEPFGLFFVFNLSTAPLISPAFPLGPLSYEACDK